MTSNVKTSGRGAEVNPANRFEAFHLGNESESGDDPLPRTQFFRDHTTSILTRNDSPDVGFSASINPYRGCEHGCAYCYARPTHEYLGFSAGLDFESKIMIKEAAPELLRLELASPKWEPQPLAISGVTDAYQPIERRLELTRRCLEVLAECRNPVGIVTKNALVARDIDLLKELAAFNAVSVWLSVTSLNAELARRLEPRASMPEHRLDAVRRLAEAGVPVGVLIAPVIPGLNDHEIPKIVGAAARAGARFAGKVLLRLPHGVADLFEHWLDQHFPLKKEKVLNQIRSVRGGKLNDPNFGSRMRGEGLLAEQISQMFHLACRRAGIATESPELSTTSFRRPSGPQMELEL